MTEFTVDLHNYPEGGSVFRRTAVRGIIERQGKYLLVREKYGDYKFPGGGAEPGETLEETTERRKCQKADIMVMESHYFFCQVEGPAAKQKLDEYEEEHGFCPVWAALPEALEQNRRAEKEQAELCARGESPIPWVTRDRMVIERLLKDGGQP